MIVLPEKVHETLGRHMITDGFEMVFDLKKSKGCNIYDARYNRYLLDGFSFFASSPLGTNHPELNNPEFIRRIGEIAVNKPTNSDIYTSELAEFVDTFSKIAMPIDLNYLFFISGGALAVENAIKTAFDWKIRKNLANGKGELGKQVIHFKEAFHGRSGYTLSLTNTFNLDKIKYFTKFDWPRIINPKISFPLSRKNIDNVINLEKQAIKEIEDAISTNQDDIAALIIEPIQGEGGDNHFREEFFKELRKLCNKYDIMFIIDEIQTGVGITGKMWAYEHFNFKPDILVFGKKTQVCGIMVGKRIEEIRENVFKVSNRLNSTWGGNLVDMFRCQKYLEIINEQNLIKNAEKKGKILLTGLKEISKIFPNKITNVRGRGLMCAFDCETPKNRDKLRKKIYENGLVLLGCGATTIRFRPPLIISSDEINLMLSIINKSLKEV
jgi:L-lysine 6-transaminase